MKYIITEEQFRLLNEGVKITNKFDFEVGRVYNFDELPKKIKSDIEVQFEDNYDESPYDFDYKAVLLNPEDTEEYLHNQFGEYDIAEAISHPYMKKIINSIKKGGIDYPSVGVEGNHRALACYYLGIPLPYLEMIPVNDLN
jgi:hypothetical protein